MLRLKTKLENKVVNYYGHSKKWVHCFALSDCLFYLHGGENGDGGQNDSTWYW